MKFVVDECAGPTLAGWLQSRGHEVVSVFDEHRGISDDQVLFMANASGSIIITSDKDFGEMIFHQGRTHRGVVLLRLSDERANMKIQVVAALLKCHGESISGRFLVVSEDKVRIARTVGI